MKPLTELARAWWREGIETGNDDLCNRAMKLWDTIHDTRNEIIASLGDGHVSYAAIMEPVE